MLFVGQVRAAGVTSPTLLTSLQQASAGLSAATATPPMSTIRLTMPQQTRQRAPAAAFGTAATPQMPAQVLKVMGSQPGSIPQIITLSSPRAVRTQSLLHSISFRVRTIPVLGIGYWAILASIGIGRYRFQYSHAMLSYSRYRQAPPIV